MAEVEELLAKPEKPRTKKPNAEYIKTTPKEIPGKRITPEHFRNIKAEIIDFLDDGHSMSDAAKRFEFPYETLRRYIKDDPDVNDGNRIRVNHRVMSQSKVELPPMAPLPELTPGNEYRIVSGVHSGGFAADDCELLRYVRAVDAPHATGGKLYLFESGAGCIESFTEYQIRTCFGARIIHHGGATKTRLPKAKEGEEAA